MLAADLLQPLAWKCVTEGYVLNLDKRGVGIRVASTQPVLCAQTIVGRTRIGEWIGPVVGCLLIDGVDVGAIRSDAIVVEQGAGRDVPVGIEMLYATSVGSDVEIIVEEVTIDGVIHLGIEAHTEVPVAVAEIGGEAAGPIRVGLVDLLVIIGVLAIAISIHNDRIALNEAVAGIVVVHLTYSLTWGKAHETCNLRVGYRHFTVTHDTIPFVAINIVVRFTNEEVTR